MKREKRKIRYFSWWEYAGLLAAGVVLSALPAIFYGASLKAAWQEYRLVFLWYFLYWALVAGALCAVTAYQKYRRYETPIRRLSQAAGQVAGGDFSVFIEPLHRADKLDYIDAMFRDFNKMVAELSSIETMKNDFIANVSHEIKTPLAVIRNYTAMLQREDLSPETRAAYIGTVVEATDRLSALVGNILKLGKLENQQIAVCAQPYDLCRQLCECALQFEPLWERKGICFEAELQDCAVIEADASLLEIVWNNLLANALKFTQRGGTVTLRQTADVQGITVSVLDTGCGMDEATKRHIFDKFYQGDTAHAGEGNGLGLALARRAIERAGGTLNVESALGVGSTFTVRLLK